MNPFDARSRFNIVTQPSHVIRVDDTHPLDLYLGLDSEGRKIIEYIGKFDRIRVRGTRIIEASHLAVHDGIAIVFTLLDKDFDDLFYLFCNDIVDSGCETEQGKGYDYVVNRFEKWKSFISQTRRYLSETEIRGLIGELLFMIEDAVPNYGINRTIQGWSGPEPAKKDFSFDETWYGVKTTSTGKITITSIDQLDSDVDGHLVVFGLEKMSSQYSGITLTGLVQNILGQITLDADRSDFITKLVHIGYYQESYYDDFVYSKLWRRSFIVDEGFPIIRRCDVPVAVSAVTYDLALSMIESFKENEHDAE